MVWWARGCGRRSRSRRSVTPPRTTPGSPTCCPLGWRQPACRYRTNPACLAPSDPYPASLTIGLEKVETLRYGENPHQPAARYRRPGSTADDGPVRDRRAAAPGQGPVVQQCPRRVRGDRARPSASRPGLRHRQAHEPVRRSRATDVARGLGGRARGRPGIRIRWSRRPDPAGRRGRWPRRSSRSSSRSSSPPASTPAAMTILATKPNLRLVVDPRLAADDDGPRSDPTGSIRTAGGAVLVTAPDTLADDPSTWTIASSAAPAPTSAATSTSPGGSSAA